jgi:hypothetical protein
MKVFILALAAVTAGPCSAASTDGVSGQPASTGAPAVAPSAAPATPGATTAGATVAAAPRAAFGAGPCALLEQKCRRCPPGGAVQTACNGALTAGAVDPSACTNALNDRDIKSQCGGGAPAPPPTVTQPAPSPAPPGAGPCGELARKCSRCPAGPVSTACNGALTAGALDPASCVNALADKDIRRLCN